MPYAGFKGDYQSIQVLKPTPASYPWLAKRNGNSFSEQSDGATYTFTEGDVPYVLVHLDHQVRRIRMEVRDATSGKSWGRALDESYWDRNSTATGFFWVSWDGVTLNGKQSTTVPRRKYKITLSVEKALGEDKNAAHWESWTSPSFNIARQ